MKKCTFIFLLLLVMASAFGQKKPVNTPAPKSPPKASLVHLLSSDKLEYTKDANGVEVAIVHKGVFQQDFSTLTSDSAYFYEKQNMLDAFGHVNINQGDTLNIYSDKLHYDGNTKLATLTNHVKMIDKDATLTTNFLTYNTATRIGIYTDGGKLVNKDNTLISKNGYYFAFTRDEYFRYDVVCTTPDAIIKTDTLRYNSKDRISYFYGPTRILGKKDKDTLYTENGTYNTVTEIARFGKKNLYTQGSKTLKGDSLFYDRLKGYGRATKHVTFNDTEQKITLKGDLGEYFKDDDKAIVTQNAYMIIVTEEKDSTKTDSLNKQKLLLSKDDSLANGQNKADSTTIKRLGLMPQAKTPVDSATVKRLGLVPITKTKIDSVAINKSKPSPVVKPKTVSANKNKPGKQPANTVKPPIVHIGPPLATIAKPGAKKVNNTPVKKKADSLVKKKDTLAVSPIGAIKPPDNIKRDSIFIGADTLETWILTYKDYKLLQKQRWEASHRDTSIKIFHSEMLTKPPKVLTLSEPRFLRDTSLYHPEFFGKPKPKVVAQKKAAKPVDPKKARLDSIKNVRVADSLQKIADHGLVDTSRIRILNAHHHAKLFKSDLQAKSDSMFYSYSDSTIRMFVHPMIWTQASQLSGDTITLQMKNKKLDNMDLFPNSFIVNIEKNDSLNFNQVGGRTMHGTFKDNKLSSMRVFGNAETIAYKRDSVTNKVTDMERSVSNRAYAIFVNGEVRIGGFVGNHEAKLNPIKLVKKENKTLKNFLWKPKERPASKQDILASYKPPADKKPAKGAEKSGPVKGTMPIKTPTKGKPSKNAGAKPGTEKPAILKQLKDTIARVKQDSITKKDTLKK